MAKSTPCPKCNKPLIVEDVDVKGQRGPIREIKTCGRITIGKRGRLIAEHIEAHGGIDCEGIIDSKRVISGQTVTLGPKSQFKGDLTAPSMEMQAGARFICRALRVPEDPDHLADLDRPTS